MAVHVKQLVDQYKMTVLAGEEGLNHPIELAQITRPGLELAGMFDFYENDRLQLIGSKEMTFFYWLNENDQNIRVRMLFEQIPPAFIFTRNVEVPEVFIRFGKEFKVPVLKSQMKTNELFSSMYRYLSAVLAPRQSIHATLVDINGVGVLIRGSSGIGKSEVALELVRRGHQLVADDRVDIYQREPGILVGEAPELLQKYLEIRGIGIVNVVKLFGASAYKENKRIMLAVDLVSFEEHSDYDRLGLEELSEKIFDTEIPCVTIPITAARSVPSLVEVAAMNARLKFLGTNMASEFNESLNHAIQSKNKK